MSKSLLSVSSFVVSFAAIMLATWFFQRGQGIVGLYNLFIAAISTLTFIAVRAQP